MFRASEVCEQLAKLLFHFVSHHPPVSGNAYSSCDVPLGAPYRKESVVLLTAFGDKQVLSSRNLLFVVVSPTYKRENLACEYTTEEEGAYTAFHRRM